MDNLEGQLAEARERFRWTQSQADAVECERLYKLIQEEKECRIRAKDRGRGCTLTSPRSPESGTRSMAVR